MQNIRKKMEYLHCNNKEFCVSDHEIQQHMSSGTRNDKNIINVNMSLSKVLKLIDIWFLQTSAHRNVLDYGLYS